jgi:hypothetical protein
VDDHLPRSCTRMSNIAHKSAVRLLIWLRVPAEVAGQLSNREALKVLLWAVRLDSSTKIYFLQTWCAWRVFACWRMPCQWHFESRTMPLRPHAAPTTLPLLRLFKGCRLCRRPPCTELTATSCIASASVWPNTRQEERQLLSFRIMMFMMFLFFFLSYWQLLLLLFLWLFLLFSLLLLLLLSLLPACLICGRALQLFVLQLFRRLLVG